MEIPSKHLEKAVEYLSSLPGIGKKTALRLALYLLRQPDLDTIMFGESIIDMKKNTQFCKRCFNISDDDLCSICNNVKRDNSLICVVEEMQNVIAIENTHQYSGMYHVLGGLISPMDGIGPDDLKIEELVKRVEEDNVKEVILALSTTVEGDTTNFYLYKRLLDKNINVSTIARGVSIGDEIEYIDEITLGNSILHRMPYSNNLKV